MHADLYTWDPMVAYWRGRWWLYSLGHERDDASWHSQPFWTRGHGLYGFASDDFKTWEPLGKVADAEPGTRLCAGAIAANGDELLAWLGCVEFAEGNWALDQSVRFYRSEDGTTWGQLPRPFVPASPTFSSGVFSANEPRRPYFGCRDMFVAEFGGTYYLYVPTGGKRWQAETRVVVMQSDDLHGPWSEPTIAAGPIQWYGHEPLQEFERVSVVEQNGTYYMTGACWEGWVPPTHREQAAAIGEPITSYTMHLLTADNPLGPFQLKWDMPFIRNTGRTGQYGALLIESTGGLQSLGWMHRAVRVDPSQTFDVDLETQCAHL